MADVKWIKIATNIFDNDKFDAIETLPDGMIIELAWLKLLCLAGKCNCGGMLVIADEIPYTDEMLAKRFHMEIGVVQRAIDQFERLGMIEVVDSAYMVSNWSRYQSTDRLDSIREKDRERKRQKRLEEKVHGNSTDISDGNALISISNSISNISDTKSIENIKEIIDYLNTKANTKYKYSTDKTKKHIHARLEEGFTVEDFKTVIDKKCAEWIGTDWEKYLRPETLFGTKFENYLNQKDNGNKQDARWAFMND